MDFKFEPGNYYLAGREQLEGQQVLRIEYYPTRMFNDDDDEGRATRPTRRKQRHDNARRDRSANRERERNSASSAR